MSLKPSRQQILVLLGCLLLGIALRWYFGASPTPRIDVRQRLEQLAGQTTHFVTREIIGTTGDPAELFPDQAAEQNKLVKELRAVAGDRKALLPLLRHPDPKVRTLALGALFMRLDPHDLPLIAGHVRDDAATFPSIQIHVNNVAGNMLNNNPASGTSVSYPAQTVGGIARGMLLIYLDAACLDYGATDVPTLFERYWQEHKDRTYSASWFAVRMVRTKSDESLSPSERESAFRQIRAEISRLPPAARGWTQFFVQFSAIWSRNSTSRNAPASVSEKDLVAGLKDAGAESVMRFLQHKAASDDPDIAAATQKNIQHGDHEYRTMSRFILDHARELLRPSDADAVQAAGEGDPFWRGVANELRAMQSPDRVVASLKSEIQAIDASRPYDSQQPVLAAALWQIAGAAEKDFLSKLFYERMAPVGRGEEFLIEAQRASRPDTSALLSTIVSDRRFAYADYAVLVQLLRMVSATLPKPLPELDTIYQYQPNSSRPEQQAVMTGWRNTLRGHFALPLLPPPTSPAQPRQVLTNPAWSVAFGSSGNVLLAISRDGRFLAEINNQGNEAMIVEAATGRQIWRKAPPEQGRWMAIDFPPETPSRVAFTLRLRGTNGFDYQDALLAVALGNLDAMEETVERTAFSNRAGGGGGGGGGGGRGARGVGGGGGGGGGASSAVSRASRGPSSPNLSDGVLRLSKAGIPTSSRRAMSPGGKFAAIAGGPHLLLILDVASGDVVHTLTEFSGQIGDFQFSPDGQILAVTSAADDTRLWDVATGTPRLSLHYPVNFYGNRPVISADGRWLAVTSTYFPTAIFDLTNGELRWEIQSKFQWGTPSVFSPDGKFLYTAGERLEAWPLH